MIAGAVAALLIGQATPAPHPSPSAQTIFRSAFQRLQSYPISPYVVYTVRWHVTKTSNWIGSASTYDNDEDYVERYAWRASDGTENFSNTAPHRGLPFARIVHQFLGPFAWSLRTVRTPAPSSPGLQPDIDGLKTIAVAVAVAKPIYTMNVIGIEYVDGHRTYHLALHPTIEPVKHNLRDLWIDTQTYDLWKARFTGFYANSPTTVTTTLRNVAGYHVVAQAQWSFTSFGTSVDCDTETAEMVFPGSLPGWLFDTAAYERQQKSGAPDVVGEILQAAAAPEQQH